MSSVSLAGLFGGPLLGVREAESVAFFDWQTGALVRRLEVVATNVYWSQSKKFVCITTAAEAFVLSFNADAAAAAMTAGSVDPDEGVEEAFEVVGELATIIATATWAGDCMIFTDSGATTTKTKKKERKKERKEKKKKRKKGGGREREREQSTNATRF